jgi:hypothetical protein
MEIRTCSKAVIGKHNGIHYVLDIGTMGKSINT